MYYQEKIMYNGNRTFVNLCEIKKIKPTNKLK